MNNSFRLLKIGALGLALGASALACAQVTKQGQAYLFRAKHTKGMKLKYLVTTRVIGISKQPNIVTVPAVSVVNSVTKGIADVTVTIGPSKMNGKVLKPAATQEVQIDSMNRVVGGQASQLGGESFPEKPVRVGGTWVSKIPTGLPEPVDARFKFRGLKSIGAKRVAVIDVAITAATGGMNISGRGTMQVLMADGSQNKLDMTLTMSAPPAQGRPQQQPIQMIMSLVRQ